MNRTEAAQLCRTAQAYCPQQKFDELSPEAWATLLDDIRIGDALEALRTIAKRQPFVAPSEIRAEVRRTRRDRIAAAGQLEPPEHVDPDDVLGWVRWHREERRRVADGKPATVTPIGRKTMPKGIAATFRKASE